MGSSVARRVAQYRLLFVQPEPENGERVCVGLLIEEPGCRPVIVYDRDFSKARCVAPAIDVDLLRFYFEALEANLRDSPEVEITLKTFGPHLIASGVREVRAPVTDEIKLALFQRFALPGRRLHTEVASTAAQNAQRVNEIAAFVDPLASRFSLPVIRQARAEQLFGKRFTSIGSVAVAIRRDSGVVLLDGVNLRAVTPKRTLSATNKVVHTFWQYGRLREHDLSVRQVPFQRVGIVLNGEAKIPRRRRAEYADAHDYALDQFRKEAELTVDTASPKDTEALLSLLGS